MGSGRNSRSFATNDHREGDPKRSTGNSGQPADTLKKKVFASHEYMMRTSPSLVPPDWTCSEPSTHRLNPRNLTSSPVGILKNRVVRPISMDSLAAPRKRARENRELNDNRSTQASPGPTITSNPKRRDVPSQRFRPTVKVATSIIDSSESGRDTSFQLPMSVGRIKRLSVTSQWSTGRAIINGIP